MAYTSLPERRVLDILGGEQLAALIHMLDEYRMCGATGDSNTFGSGGLGYSTTRR